MGALHSWSNIFPEDNTDVVFLDRSVRNTYASLDRYMSILLLCFVCGGELFFLLSCKPPQQDGLMDATLTLSFTHTG